MGLRSTAGKAARSGRSRAWYVARRLGAVPSGQADRLGEDDALRGATFTQQVMVFFPDPPGSLYQLEQWYETLSAVDAELGVVLVLQDSRTARSVRARTGLTTIVVALPATLDDLLSRSRFELCLYVNHHPANFTNLRLRDLVHVSLIHGDSDKSVSVSNQLKGYDYSFVAGQAAVDRVSAAMFDYDAARHCVVVGRPQIDELLAAVAALPAPDAGDRSATVLYAPSWAGPQPESAYGSVASHGETLVRSLIDSGYRVIYRPHALTALNDRGYAAADARIRQTIDQAGAPHRADLGVPLAQSFADADLLVCDISGVAVDWLSLDRPLVITHPAEPRVWLSPSRLRESVPSLRAEDAATFGARVPEILADEDAPVRRNLAAYYLGETDPGAARRRFVEACGEVIERRRSEVARRQQSQEQDPQTASPVSPENKGA